MKEGNELIRRTALEHLTNKDRILFVTFMEKRFPEEESKNYILEWIERWKSGNLLNYMDNQSLQHYKESVKETIEKKLPKKIICRFITTHDAKILDQILRNSNHQNAEVLTHTLNLPSFLTKKEGRKLK